MTILRDPEGTETAILHGLVEFKGKDVLEIGCGNGRLTWRFANQAQMVIAIDPDGESIVEAVKNKPNELEDRVQFVETGFLDFKPKGEVSRFDIIILSWSLCCMEPEDMEHSLKKSHELLKTDGILINIQPYGDAKYLEIHQDKKVWRAGSMKHKTNWALHKQARASLQKVIKSELFIAERECNFPFLSHFGAMAYFEEWMSENWESTILGNKTTKHAKELEKKAGTESEVIVRDKIFIAALRANAK